MEIRDLSDIGRVLRVLAHPDVNGITDLNILAGFLAEPSIYVLMPNDDTVFLFFPVTEEVCSGHVYVMPQSRGRVAIKAEREALRWLMDNTIYKMVVGFVPNVAHIELFHRLVGMKCVPLPEEIKMFYWTRE